MAVDVIAITAVLVTAAGCSRVAVAVVPVFAAKFGRFVIVVAAKFVVTTDCGCTDVVVVETIVVATDIVVASWYC